MADELNQPLKRRKRGGEDGGGRRFRIAQLPLARIMGGVAALLVIVTAGRILLIDDPGGGRPTAEVAISSGPSGNEVADEVTTSPPDREPEVATQRIGGEDGSPSITVLGDDIPDSGVPGGNPDVAALNAFGARPALVEETPNGPLPMVGPEGQTPFAAYSRASVTSSGTDSPLVAVVVSGMGLNEDTTLEAVEKLPDNVTLSFAPYARSLQRTASAARDGGHEILLELPLEPFDYPDNDPGPQTLLTGQPARANLDRLFWLLARVGGYAGVINHMGARFTASAEDFAPVMEEIGTRGLGYVDDGTSRRSLAGNLAASNDIPFRRADVEIDAKPSRSAIMSALEMLEQQAVEDGTAVGIASALPVSIDAIAEWAGGLDDKGIVLVPVSALMSNP